MLARWLVVFASIFWTTLPIHAESQFPYDLAAEDALWLQQEAERQIAGCRVQGKGAVWLNTPDGVGNYRALWVRDYYYTVQYAGELIDGDELKASIEYLLSGQRDDGCIPDRVNTAGQPVYSPGAPHKPLADHALDNGAFMAVLACAHFEQHNDADFFRSVEPRLRKGLDFTPLAENGLVYNDPKQPECIYGFTDTVKKTGHLLMCSLLYYDACQRLADACEKCQCGDPSVYRARLAKIQEHISMLWNEEAGMFWAADGHCKQIDIWGSAFSVHIGIATNEQRRRIAQYLVTHHDGIVSRGQVRHLGPDDEAWEQLFVDFHKPGEYQNGAYWATPLAWYVPVVAERDPKLAGTIVRDAVRDFRENGVHECINEGYTKVPDFVASVTSVYGLIKSGFEE